MKQTDLLELREEIKRDPAFRERLLFDGFSEKEIQEIENFQTKKEIRSERLFRIKNTYYYLINKIPDFTFKQWRIIVLIMLFILGMIMGNMFYKAYFKNYTRIQDTYYNR